MRGLPSVDGDQVQQQIEQDLSSSTIVHVSGTRGAGTVTFEFSDDSGSIDESSVDAGS